MSLVNKSTGQTAKEILQNQEKEREQAEYMQEQIEKLCGQNNKLLSLCDDWERDYNKLKSEYDKLKEECNQIKNPTYSEFEKEEYAHKEYCITENELLTIEDGIDRLLTDYCNFVERPKKEVKKELSVNEFLSLRNQALLDHICINSGGSVLSDKVYEVRLRGENE